MIRAAIFLLFGLAILGSCKKSNSASASGTLIFGTKSPFCLGHCSDFYLIKNAALYQDTNHGPAIVINFTSTPLPAAKYTLAAPLVSNFPAYLRNDTGGSLGCPGCADGPVLYLEFTDDQKHTVKWSIDPDTSLLPLSVRTYIQQVNTVLNQL